MKLPTSVGALLSLSPFHVPSKQLFPRGVATVEALTTEAGSSNDTKIPQAAQVTSPARHVFLPFDLTNPKVDPLSDNVLPLLRAVFPGVAEITYGFDHLHFSVKELPKRPWPLTVGGLPITIADQDGVGRGPLFPVGAFGNPRIAICNNYNAKAEELTDAAFRQLSKDIYDTFSKDHPSVRLIEVMHEEGSSFIVIVGDETLVNKLSVSSKLPGKVAGCLTRYINDKDMHRPSWLERKAKRALTPQPATGHADNTAYDILRPGVMLHSLALRNHAHPLMFSTTSGVCVQNAAGDKFLTSAAHGVGEAGMVHQVLPDGTHRHVGKVVHEVAFNDICIIQIESDIQCVNEPFENSANVTPTLKRLYGEDPTDQFRKHDLVHLDSPYTGDMEGCIVARSIKMETLPTAHSTEARLEYVLYKWFYAGQLEGTENDAGGSSRIPEGTCGSAIWNDEGVVLGFFHYLIEAGEFKGFAASIDASELVRMGYSLA